MSQRYLLHGAGIVTAGETFQADLRVRNRRICEIGSGLRPGSSELQLDCSGHFIYPGLINSHDHLAFNLFPRLGEPPYENSYEWGRDLHAKWNSTIESIQRIPLRWRLAWGAWKNLLSGISLVIHHDHYSLHFLSRFPIEVFRRYTFAHSMQFDPDLRDALARRKRGAPFMIHLAEGKDDACTAEVKSLNEVGGLDERTVAVHAVGITEDDIRLLQKSRASVVWCPSSNIFLFGKTAPVMSLCGRVPLALGTDSTLTGSLTLFDEMRAARKASSLSAKDIFALVTEAPRRIFGLASDAGTLCREGSADLFMLPDSSGDPYETVLAANPGTISLSMKGGRPVFFDPALFPHLINGRGGMDITLEGKGKFITDNDFPRLYKNLRPYLGHYSYLDVN
ncbi:MAG: amidohydrolase family protein [Ignavibacteria bacterium]|nr:amidohydrolase family protein [Ignavibacteria bacterium]